MAQRRSASKTPTPAPPDKRALARAALEAFWGQSNGGAKAYGECEERLRGLSLDKGLLTRLRHNLPVTPPGGTTHQRIETARALLSDLLEEAR